jgi:hypothetical protein
MTPALSIDRRSLVHISRPSEPMNGPRGLIAAVVHQARADLTCTNPEIQADALAYFAGPVYQQDLEILGLAPDVLPIGITRQ